MARTAALLWLWFGLILIPCLLDDDDALDDDCASVLLLRWHLDYNWVDLSKSGSIFNDGGFRGSGDA